MENISNTTTLSRGQLYRHNLFQMHKNPIIILSFVIIVLYAIGQLFKFVTNKDMIGFIAVLCMIICLLALYILVLPLFGYSKIKNTVFEFSFGPESADIRTQRPGANAQAQYQYAQFSKAYERKDAFYLYINKRQALIVNKSGFVQGGAEELREILKSKLGRKFKEKKR